VASGGEMMAQRFIKIFSKFFFWTKIPQQS